MNKLSGASKKIACYYRRGISILENLEAGFMGVIKMFRVSYICIIMYSPKEVTYNPNMLSIYLLKSMAFPQSSSSSSSSSLSTASNHCTKKHHLPRRSLEAINSSHSEADWQAESTDQRHPHYSPTKAGTFCLAD
jgi:hypothetical protein